MKYKLRKTGKRSLSMILAILMMISTLLVGTIANAASETFTEGSKIYFTPGSNWILENATFKATIHYSNSSDDLGKTLFTAELVAVSGETNMYYFTLPSGTNYSSYMRCIVFHRYSPSGTEWASFNILASSRASDDQNYLTHSGWEPGTNTWSKYTETSTTTGYRVAGAQALCGTNWDTNDTNNDMTDNGDGTYTKVYTGVAAGTYEYKIAKTDGSWVWDSNNCSVTVTSEQAGSSGATVTITYNTANPNTATAEVSSSGGSSGGDSNLTEISSLTETKATNKIIANTNTSAKAKSAWLWVDGGNSNAYNLTEVGSLSTQYLSYYSHSMSSPNAIFFQGTVKDGSSSWPGDTGNTRITSNDVKASNGLNASVDGHTSVIDGNYYFATTSTTSDQTKFTVFDHIGGTITPDKTEITLGESITLTGAATAGTLRKSKINVGSDKFTYVVRDSNGKYYRIGDEKTDSTTVTWKPTVGGTYTICGLVTDPFGFESIKVAETTVTVNNPVQQKYTVTYSAGANGSLSCAQDTVNVESDSQVVAGTNVKFTITPDEGYEVDTFIVNGEDKKSSITNGTYTHTVESNTVVNVTFKKTTYTITVDSNIPGGTVTPSVSSANMGDSITLTVTPDKGYFLKSITVTKASDETVTCTNKTFTMPAANVTVSATFVSYRITGSLTTAGTNAGKDSTWDSFTNGMAFDTQVSDTVYSKTITLEESDFTTDKQRNKFRLISSDSIIYRPDNSDTDPFNNKRYLITQNNSETNSYATVSGTSDNYFYFDKPGEYTIFIKYVDGGNPKIWAVRGAFNLTSESTNCTVEFYSDSALTNQITKSKAGETVYVKVIPNTNYEVESVTADNVTPTPVSGEENVYSFDMPSDDVKVTATAETIKQKISFTFLNSTLKVSYVYNGNSFSEQSVTNGGTVTVDKGSTISITGSPSEGYEAVTPTAWIVAPDPSSTPTTTATTCSFTVSGDATVTYNTKKTDYTINYVYNSSQGGTTVVKVNNTEVTKLNIGDKFTVDTTVNTSDGYEIDSLVVKAESTTLYPDDGIYTMTTGNVTVTTTYKAIKPMISNCPTETVVLNAGERYTIPATTDYGSLSYSSEPTDDFKFSGNIATAPNKEGNYTITITATNKPEGITTAATTTATFNVTVKFTDTQKAYKELEEKFAEIGHENSEYYEDNAAWTAYKKAVDDAKALLITFPLPTANNTADYDDAKKALQDAYDKIQKYKKVNTIYVLSQYPEYVNLHMFASAGESYEPVGDVSPIYSNENDGSKGYAMTKVGTVKVGNNDRYLYKFEYFGKANFVVYKGSSSTSSVANGTKLTGDVTTCKGFNSYYFDLKDVSNNNTDKTTYDASPYVPLTVELTKTSDTCVEDAKYNLTTKIQKTEGGTLKETSEVIVNHSYTDTLNGTTTDIASPSTWVPETPGVHTITITSSNGADNPVTNTFTLYVQDKLDKPVISINGSSESQVYVNIETDVNITVRSNGEDYPAGVKYEFTVGDKVFPAQSSPTLTYTAGTLSLGDRKVTVRVIAPDTKFSGTGVNKYVVSPDESSDETTLTIETVKYRYTFDFTNCHVNTNSVSYNIEGVATTFTELSGTIAVDKGSPVSFAVTMNDGYRPIPNDKDDKVVCWSGVTDATVGDDKLSYSFTANSGNAGTEVVFKSFLPVEISPDRQDIKINASATISIKAKDDNTDVTYKLMYRKDTDTEYKLYDVGLNSDNKFVTSSLEYGKYKFKVKQYTDDYEYYSNVADVNAVIGTIILKYYYQEYKSENGISYDPYISKGNNLGETKTYSLTLDEDISSVVDNSGNVNNNSCVEMYIKYAPKINNNYFNYTLVTTGVTGTLSENGTKCTIYTNSLMEPTERKYSVFINGEKKFTSYYQQKTFLLDAAEYCTGAEGNGYIWYNVDSNGNTVVSTNRYYKLRVARDTNIYVEHSDKKITAPTTTINEPVYNKIILDNVVKVQMNMLVENYLPEDAVRTSTGVVYYSYEGDTPPKVDSTKLPDLIDKSSLANYTPETTCRVGEIDGTEIKGYHTISDNVNGKFIFAPIASMNSTKTYVVYSYLTYIQDNVSVTIVSNPVTASVALYKAENTASTGS